jgi:hypothetical protein
MVKRWQQEDEIGPIGKRRKRVLEELDQRPFLVERLDDDDSGMHWLKNHRERGRAYSFLQHHREQSEELLLSQFEIINRAIAEGLDKSPGATIIDQDRSAVRELDLTFYDITDGGLQHIVRLAALESINLSGTKITDQGLRQLSENNRLLHLDISNTGVTDSGLKYLEKAASLRRLILKDNTGISNSGLGHIANLTGLESLDISKSKIDDFGIDHLKGLTALRFLGIRKSGISRAGKEELERLLPGCRIVG